jgi:acyl-CoA thioester hydrolase
MASEHPERENPTFYTFWSEESVRFHDMDAYNHVNNNVIGIYFETARMEWLEKAQPKGWLTSAHFVLAKVTLEFLRELTYPNKIRIGNKVVKIGNSSMVLVSGLFVGDTCMALSESVSVWIGGKSRRPEPISASMRETLKRYS